MAYNTKPIVTDVDGNPISQYYNKELDQYEPVEGSHGANKVLVENNDLSLIPILDKLSQLTGTVIDEETRKSNELERIANEESREMAEDERDIAEQDRQSKEQIREDKEELRITAENDRVTKELERISNENTRKSNEDDRISAENTRDSNETKRVNAENVRIDNESQRESAEVVREQNEESRKSAELDRVDNEQLRNSAEWDRRRNENAREEIMDAFSVFEDYVSYKTYYPLNKVFYDGSTYICIAETKGNLPTDTDYWLVLARRGVDGEGAGDMLMEVYDTNGDGVVDNADNANKLGGYEPSYYVPGHLFSDTYDSLVNSLNGKVDNDRVKTDVPENAKFTDTITTINGKTGAISKADIVALGIPAQDTNTTYSEITTAEIDAGTSSTLRTISGRRVQHILNKVQGWINGLTKSDIGLSNVDNVKQATKTEFNAHKADLTTDADGAHGLKIESGTFTPSLQGEEVSNANTYDVREGSYYKIGSLVHFIVRLRLTSKDPAMTGAIKVTGLPFVGNSETSATIGRMDNIILPAGSVLSAYTNISRILLRTATSDNYSLDLTATAIKNNSMIFISGTYRV